jgi:hypothetical protein
MLCTNNQVAFDREFLIRVSRCISSLEHLCISEKESRLYKDQIFLPVEFLRLKMLIFNYNYSFRLRRTVSI